jgi:hypothetical protein
MTDWLEKGRRRRGLPPRKPWAEALFVTVLVLAFLAFVGFTEAPSWPSEWSARSPFIWIGLGAGLLLLEGLLELLGHGLVSRFRRKGHRP